VPPDTHRLSRTGFAVRAAATLAFLGVLAYGQIRDTNDLFPLGSLSQYATARDMNGTIRSVYLTADTAEASGERISLDQSVVGVGRAEIEGQLDRIVEHPRLLQSLAAAYAELHPNRPLLRVLHLMRSERQLRDGLVVGEPKTEELATWSVQPEDKR
jgi:hypothetical protein